MYCLDCRYISFIHTVKQEIFNNIIFILPVFLEIDSFYNPSRENQISLIFFFFFFFMFRPSLGLAEALLV